MDPIRLELGQRLLRLWLLNSHGACFYHDSNRTPIMRCGVRGRMLLTHKLLDGSHIAKLYRMPRPYPAKRLTYFTFWNACSPSTSKPTLFSL